MTSNADTVRAIYAAFGRGDVPAILDHISDDVDWDFAHAGVDVPWLAPRRGKAGVLAFFEAIPAHLEPRRFEVTAVLGDGAVVVALANVTWLVKSTGRVIEEDDEAHVWRFDARGKVIRFRHGVNTLGHAQALAR